jgi:Tol biopolymer transport system component
VTACARAIRASVSGVALLAAVAGCYQSVGELPDADDAGTTDRVEASADADDGAEGEGDDSFEAFPDTDFAEDRGPDDGSDAGPEAEADMVEVVDDSAESDADVEADGGEVVYPQRVNVSTAGEQADDRSGYPGISRDGRFVAFTSRATNLVPDDTNGAADIFVRDRLLGTTERASVDSGGTQANDRSSELSLSGDGRFVGFQSHASNLVPGDTNGVADAFVHDRSTGDTFRVSVGSGGEQADGRTDYLAISADGDVVVFESTALNLVPGPPGWGGDVYVHDRSTGETVRASDNTAGGPPDGFSHHVAISGDGGAVAFDSDATDLIAGDTNYSSDVFVRDLAARVTTRVSVNSRGVEADSVSYLPSLSWTGRLVAFTSWSTNLAPGDANGVADVFVHDRTTGETVLVSAVPGGRSGNAQSGSGTFGDAVSRISGDGMRVVFWSEASDLVAGDLNGAADIFVWDRTTGASVLVSVDSSGAAANAGSYVGDLSGDGLFVAFVCEASNLVPDDTNGVRDVFVTSGYGAAKVIE